METIFNSTPIQAGHSLTITSLFGYILNDAEIKYGERDRTYTILGIEFTTDNNPRIYFPNHSRSLFIQITNKCQTDINRAAFQVAHEAIHCLSPSGMKKATYLEEGLASYHSIEYTRNNGFGNWLYDKANYKSALDAVTQLLQIDPQIIKKIRQFEPSISAVTKEHLLATNSSIPKELAELLTTQFYM